MVGSDRFHHALCVLVLFLNGTGRTCFLLWLSLMDDVDKSFNHGSGESIGVSFMCCVDIKSLFLFFTGGLIWLGVNNLQQCILLLLGTLVTTYTSFGNLNGIIIGDFTSTMDLRHKNRHQMKWVRWSNQWIRLFRVIHL